MTSREVLALLERRHAKDLFVSECKDGPTWTASHLRLDAWAMSRSWANFQTFGYEIKVSRSDFIGDRKLNAYLPLCNSFFIVCPPGVVKSPEEVPEDAGLLVVASTGNMLLTKKKAKFRDIQDPVMLYRYILMCRTQVVRDTYHVSQTPAEFWEEWLRTEEMNRELGRKVGRRLARRIKLYAEDMSAENARLKRENEDLREVREALRKLDINPRESKYTVMAELREHSRDFPEELKQSLEWAKKSMAQAVKSVEEAQKVLEKQEEPK